MQHNAKAHTANNPMDPSDEVSDEMSHNQSTVASAIVQSKYLWLLFVQDAE
jgi:hypothetical protein